MAINGAAISSDNGWLKIVINWLCWSRSPLSMLLAAVPLTQPTPVKFAGKLPTSGWPRFPPLAASAQQGGKFSCCCWCCGCWGWWANWFCSCNNDWKSPGCCFEDVDRFWQAVWCCCCCCCSCWVVGDVPEFGFWFWLLLLLLPPPAQWWWWWYWCCAGCGCCCCCGWWWWFMLMLLFCNGCRWAGAVLWVKCWPCCCGACGGCCSCSWGQNCCCCCWCCWLGWLLELTVVPELPRFWVWLGVG